MHSPTPIGSARGQGAESLHSRDSGESFVAGRPMSGASEGSMMPPMQEVNTHPYAMPADYPFGLATGRSDGQSDSLHPQEQSLTSGRLHNYGRSAYGATDESSISHGGYNTADDEDGLYYDGSHSQGQGSRAVQGMDMAGVAVSSPRGYSPYADLQRGGSVRSASPSELTHSSDMHSEHSPYPNPHENPFEYVGGSEHERGDFGRLSPEYVMQHPQHNSSRWSG